MVNFAFTDPGNVVVPHIPVPADPVVAIILERVDRLRIDLSEHRAESKMREEKNDGRLEALEEKLDTKLDPLIAAVNKAAGGYIGIVGLAGIFIWATGLWDKIVKVFQG